MRIEADLLRLSIECLSGESAGFDRLCVSELRYFLWRSFPGRLCKVGPKSLCQFFIDL